MVRNRAFDQIMEEGDSPSFFKILRRESLSSKMMRGIPHTIIKSISEKEFSAKMVLKVSLGNSWTLRIFRNSKFHYMEKNGWERFLRDNALGNNEVLTFTHKGDMCFRVVIFQINAMEMLRPHKSASIASSSSSPCRNQREQSSNIKTDLKKKATESSSESTCPGPKTAESTGRGQRLSLRCQRAEETEKAKKKKTKLETVCSSSESETSSLVPEFTITIKKSYLIFLGIPRKFEMHMPKETTKFTIHHPNGKKSWEVTYKIDTQSRFTAGWIPLVKDLGLVAGDVCTFKLIKPTEMLLKVSRIM